MRSADLWFGVPYDVPFFCAVQYSIWKVLLRAHPTLQLGSYEHYCCNIHIYERNINALASMAKSEKPEQVYKEGGFDIKVLFEKVYRTACGYGEDRDGFLKAAWEQSEISLCIKKKTGAVLVHNGKVIGEGWGDRFGSVRCEACARDEGAHTFHGDGCWSVHAEMRAVFNAMERNNSIPFEECTMYVTHGPCDACMKLMHFVGIRTVVYDIPYKTNYKENWPDMVVIRRQYTPEWIEKGKTA